MISNANKDAMKKPNTFSPAFAPLQPLTKLVGTWELAHQDLNTGEQWGGKDTFEWLPGGYFMVFHHEEDKGINGMMILGFEKGWEETAPGKEIVGHWFESSSGFHYRYIWEVDDHTVQFWLNDKNSNMQFKGEFNEAGDTITGTWKWPGGGYTLVMKRVQS
jgi:hypothetical protein